MPPEQAVISRPVKNQKNYSFDNILGFSFIYLVIPFKSIFGVVEIIVPQYETQK